MKATYVIVMRRDMAQAGGFARAAGMTAQARKLSAKHAANVRWGNVERRKLGERRQKKRAGLDRRGVRH